MKNNILKFLTVAGVAIAGVVGYQTFLSSDLSVNRTMSDSGKQVLTRYQNKLSYALVIDDKAKAHQALLDLSKLYSQEGNRLAGNVDLFRAAKNISKELSQLAIAVQAGTKAIPTSENLDLIVQNNSKEISSSINLNPFASKNSLIYQRMSPVAQGVAQKLKAKVVSASYLDETKNAIEALNELASLYRIEMRRQPKIAGQAEEISNTFTQVAQDISKGQPIPNSISL
jgi:hypothetical protein